MEDCIEFGSRSDLSLKLWAVVPGIGKGVNKLTVPSQILQPQVVWIGGKKTVFFYV